MVECEKRSTQQPPHATMQLCLFAAMVKFRCDCHLTFTYKYEPNYLSHHHTRFTDTSNLGNVFRHVYLIFSIWVLFNVYVVSVCAIWRWFSLGLQYSLRYQLQCYVVCQLISHQGLLLHCWWCLLGGAMTRRHSIYGCCATGFLCSHCGNSDTSVTWPIYTDLSLIIYCTTIRCVWD